MTHEELSDMYELYVLGVLEPEERDEVEAHLARGCPECKRGVTSALGLTTFFGTLPPPATPSKQLRRRVLASVGAAAPAGRAWIWTWAVATACLAIVSVVSWRDETRTRDEMAAARREISARTADAARYRQVVEFMNEPGTEQVTFGKGPRGRVLVNRQRGVLFIASNLPPIPAGKTYEMWLVPKGGAPRPAGLFQSDDRGNAIHMLPGPIDQANTAAVAVSVEPETGSAAPTSTPIIVAALSD